MKRCLLILSLLPFFFTAKAQQDPVSWEFIVEKGDQPNAFTFLLKAKPEPGWFIYSQHLDPDAGPIPTSVHFNPSDNLIIEGHVQESGNKKEGYDELFGTQIAKFSGLTVFSQSIRLNGDKGMLSGYVEYMTCNDEQCLPPRQVSFSALFPN